jgi:hypothetical protein
MMFNRRRTPFVLWLGYGLLSYQKRCSPRDGALLSCHRSICCDQMYSSSEGSPPFITGVYTVFNIHMHDIQI